MQILHRLETFAVLLLAVECATGCSAELDYSISLREDPKSLYAVGIYVDGSRVEQTKQTEEGYQLATYLLDVEAGAESYEKTLEARNVKTGLGLDYVRWRAPNCDLYTRGGDRLVAEQVVFGFLQSRLMLEKRVCVYESGEAHLLYFD